MSPTIARRSSNPFTNILCVQYATGGLISTDQVNVKFALAPPLAPIDVSVVPGDRLLKVSWAKGDNADDIATYCRANLASYKCPRHIVFRDLPMTSTGKVQKFVLRDWAKAV